MKNISEIDLRIFTRDILFENQISERYGPDDFTNSRTTMFDRPGPQVNDSSSQLSYSQEIEVKVPLTSDEIMTNTAYTLKNKNVFVDTYSPTTTQELGHAILSAIELKSNDIENNHIQKVWLTLRNILDKV